MNDLSLIIYSLKSRLMNSILSVLLTAFGVSIALLILQFENHVKDRITFDGKGIDIVVGAKGSPLQLILSSVYHIDIPNGNIPFKSVETLMKHPQIETSIPIALGDNWRGHRIVGTTKNYITHYKGEINSGRTWKRNFEIISGSNVNLELGDEIIGSHGLFEGGDEHETEKYKVVGKLKQTGTVIDRLLLTPIDSVLKIHGLDDINIKSHKHDDDHNEHEHNSEHKNPNIHKHELNNQNLEKINNSEYTKKSNQQPHEDDIHHDDHDHDHHDNDGKKEKTQKKESSAKITALLLITNTPIANANLPRLINSQSNLQAANPAIEIARLTSVLGLGSKSFRILSTILIGISILSIFSGLASNLENRSTDLAILRAIGYSKNRIFKIISIEGMLIVVSGITLGIILAISIFALLIQNITPLKISQAAFNFNYDILLVIVSVIVIGLVASIFPALRASKISVAKQLAKNT